jgi:LytS/YehU family sensor histidine kinase
MAEMEMQSLRSQLNPHFMFNSLNSIQTLILKEDSDRSHSYLSRFARLLRMLLENTEKAFVPLQKEIDFLQLYLSLESLRIPDLQYSIFTDPAVDMEHTFIPNMILQPYVENAIWHGLSHKEGDRQLEIRISRDNGLVKYEIEDNGVGRKKAQELKSLFRRQHQSKGMELLDKRFKLLNGEFNSSIETLITDVVKSNEIAGTLVTVNVPVQLSIPSSI